MNQMMNILFCTDIHANSGTVQNQNVQVVGKPFGKNNLLLITAGQSGSKLPDIICLDGKFFFPYVSIRNDVFLPDNG